MTFLLNYLLIFSLSSLTALHGLHKAKRDLSDLKDDALLRSLFTSDLKEKRKDRSILLQDEQETNQKIKGSIASPSSYYNTFNNNNGLPQKVDERRAVNPAQEAFSNSPLISDSLPVMKSQASFQTFQGFQSPAVDPALVAANFMPLPQQQDNFNGMEAKRSSIPPSLESASTSPESSYPLQLHVHSPNAAIQGVAPHFEEFGETVESIKRAQKAQKRFVIPKPEMYDSHIFKKNSIPHPEESSHSSIRKSKMSKSKHGHKKSETSSKKKTDKGGRRQFIPQIYQQQQSYMYNNPAYANDLQTNGLFAQGQGSMVQFQSPQQPKVASQVQNLDGAISRPVISEEGCSDQYAQCSDFAKNDYCTKFRPQMEVQCRKSCKFCVESAPLTTGLTSQRSDDSSGDTDSGDGSGSGESDPVVKPLEMTGAKRHDVLQERGNVPAVDTDMESGSGSGSGESGSGENAEISEPEFQFPNKKTTIDNDNSETEESGDSGSGSDDDSSNADLEATAKTKKSSISSKPVKHEVKIKHTRIPKPVKHEVKIKRTKIPKPLIAGSYPRIDLKAIASALAHYEEAALELAGEYPKPQDVDVTEYTRSFIPHPENPEDIQENRNRQNIQIAKIITAERARKSNIPKFLRVTNDVKKSQVKVTDADSIDEVQRRFEVPGVEPTLNDYYAETGRLNPFEKKTRNYKKSRIEKSNFRNSNFDPYQYLRNMPAGASMEPIIDPSKRSEIPADHSYPVFLMKVSPADEKKYIDEPADRRGKIRHFDAEGLQVSPERANEIQREKIAQYEAETLSAVPLSAVTQKSSMPNSPIALSFATADTTRREQFPQQHQQQQQFQQQAAFAVPAEASSLQQMQPNRYASSFAEQQTPENRASLFQNSEPVGFEQRPGESALRGKMLSAFFDVKSNNNPEEGSGAGSGDSGQIKDLSNLQSLLSSETEQRSEPFWDKHNSGENKDSIPSSYQNAMKAQKLNNMFSFNEKKDTISSPQDTNNYLRSNLAQLTPETNTMYSNYQLQSPLTSSMLGAQFAMDSMPKTQETSWIRPNAQSELASAMPLLKQSQLDSSPYTSKQSEEASNYPVSNMNQPETGISVPPYYQAQMEPSDASSGQNQLESGNHDFPTIVSKSDIVKPVASSYTSNVQMLSNPTVKKQNIPQENLLSSAQQQSIMAYFHHQPSSPDTNNKHKASPQHTDTVPKSIIPKSLFAQQKPNGNFQKHTYKKSSISRVPFKIPAETTQDFYNVGSKSPKFIVPKPRVAEETATKPNTIVPDASEDFFAPTNTKQTVAEVSSEIFPKSTLPSALKSTKPSTPQLTMPSIPKSTLSLSPKLTLPFSQITEQPKIPSIYNRVKNDTQVSPDLNRVLQTRKQYLPFASKAVNSAKETLSVNSNQQATSFSADAANAKYDVTKSNLPNQQMLKLNISSDQAQNSLQSNNVEIHPLSRISFERKPSTYDTELFKKNLIKQKPELDCDDGWKGAEGDFGTFCYKDTNLQATYDDAFTHCRRLKGNLFSVLNAYENRYLQDNVHTNFWIGYRDKGMNGNWNWTDGSRSIYTNWGKDLEDSNARHDCVYIDTEEGNWRDENCTKEMSFLCKMKTDSCPQSPEKWDFLQMRDTNSVNGCYRLFNDSMSWEDAAQLCRSKGAQIASISSESEQTVIYQHFSSKSFWIGFNDRENEGDWQWADHVTSSYTNWAENAPDNGGLSCASMAEGGKWHDEKCNKKMNVVCKKRGPKPEKTDGFNNDGILLPVARLLKNEETAPSHLYDNLEKDGSAPVVPVFYWPLLKNSKLGMTGNRPMAVNGDVKSIAGGVQLDGQHSFLDAGDFHGKCVGDPDKCSKGFSVGIQVKFDDIVKTYQKPRYVIDTAGQGKGFAIYIAEGQLHYKVVSKEGTWEKATDLTTSQWQDIVMTWNKAKGFQIYVNGAIKDSQSKSESSEITSTSSSQMLIGRQNSKGTSPSTKMVVASVAMFSKQLSIEDVPYAFTYGDTVVASYRWLMNDVQNSEIPAAPEMEKRKDITDIDGGIFVDGSVGWLQIDDFPNVIHDLQKATYGFSVSFKLKFDQRVREYKEPRYVLDTGGHVDGVNGISVYLVNDNMYFQVISSNGEDVMKWKVRAPIYTVRWQQIVMTWRLDKGLWVYLDGMFRGHTVIPEVTPEEVTDLPKRFYIGRKNKGPDFDGAVFGFSSLAIYGRYLKRTETEKVFGNTDNPFQGIIREVWRNIEGETLQELKANADFPNNPTTIEIIQNFDAPFNVDKNYGSKLKGYFIAPETGNSTFLISCSRACELFFSEDEEGKSKEKIIKLNESTEHNVWNKYENQSSREIFLVAGKYYYLEAVQKGVDSSDSLSVGVQLPTGRYQRPINKENLQWRLPGNPHAGLIRDVWYNVPGYTVTDLTSDPNYPHRPSSTEVLDKFDSPFNVDDNYGSRISGYFHAPESGEYRFYLATDSSGELWISKDESEANLQKIITLNGWTDHNEWTKYPDQKSDKLFLVAGKYYYVRVYMKADKLGDCASVAVELPSGRFEGPMKKKHLSWKLVGSKEGPGPKEVIDPIPKPVGLFELNDASMKNMFAGDDGNRVRFNDVELTTGPRDAKDEAISFNGNSTSFVEIPNNGSLDTRNSITILANIYPTGDNGPIINYNPNGWGVHLWQFGKTELFVRFVPRKGGMNIQPLGTRVLQLNAWNQVGASYDRNTGVAQLWHDGKMVKSRNIGQIELSTELPIRLGARIGDERYFEGKMSCVQIYDKALNEEEIGELRNCPSTKDDDDESMNSTAIKEEDLTSSFSDMEDFTLYQAGGYEAPEVMENRIGDDTEEELIVQGEKNRATRCDPNPCKNNGSCKDDDKKIDGYICMCSDEYTGRRCQVSRSDAENPVVKRTNIPTPSNVTTARSVLTNQTAENTFSQSPINSTAPLNQSLAINNNTSFDQPNNNTALNQSSINSTVNSTIVGANKTSINGVANNTLISNETVAKSDKEDISLLYQKLGCFKDNPSNHDLKTKIDLKRTTQEECAKACAMKDKTYSYFGLQNGTSCYCGKDHGKYGKLPDNQCNVTCDGNQAENCGGEEANNVFFYGLGTSYTVKTFTGKEFGAGTDAKIYFELVGDRGTSDFRQLDSNPSKYETGSVDTQTFMLPDLGRLKRMKILHDNTGTAPSWFLQKVQVTDEEGGNYEFLCDDWLSDTKSGGKLERELTARSIVPRIT